MFIYRQNPPSRLIKPKAARDDRLDSATGIRVLPDLSDDGRNHCKSIYLGCCVLPNTPCEPCERIAAGHSTVAEEMAKKERLNDPRHREQGFKRSRKSPATGPAKTQQVLAMFAKGKSRVEISLALGIDRGVVVGIIWRSKNREKYLAGKRAQGKQAKSRGAPA